METKEKIEKYCQSTKVLEKADITLLKHGISNDVYLLKTPHDMYAAHVGNMNKDDSASLNNASRSLKYLESKGVDFVPQVASFSTDENILVETYVGKYDVAFNDLSNDHLDLFAAQLVKIHSFDYRDIQKFSKENGYEMPQVHTFSDEVKTFGTDRFKRVQQTCPDKMVLDWIEPKLQENVTYAESSPLAQTPRLRQGDDLRGVEDKLWIVDWKYSRLTCKQELSYLKIHNKPSPERFAFLVERYAQHGGVSQDEVVETVVAEEKMTRVHDVILAAMKWGENGKGSIPVSLDEGVSYKDLTHKRMKLYDDFVDSL